MSYSWKFAPSSQQLLKRCIESATTKNTENKWIRYFGRDILKNANILAENSISNNNINVNDGSIPHLHISESPTHEKSPNKSFTVSDVLPDVVFDEISDVKHLENICDNINAEPLTNYELMVAECSKNKYLYKLLAQKLSEKSTSIICSKIFNNKHENSAFVYYFYVIFIPTYLKREYNLFSLDMLLKASKAHPSQFEKVLRILIEDLEIPQNVLHDYITALNSAGKTELMNHMIRYDISSKVFVNHLLSLNLVYKDCIPSERVQKFLINNFNKSSYDCKNDRNYGRLLLSYIQTQRSMDYKTDFELLEKLIERHCSPFKRPCVTIFKEMLEKFDTS